MVHDEAMATEHGSTASFSIVMAYALPGFTALKGLPFLDPNRITWGTADSSLQPTLSSFLSGTTEAVAVGLIVSTVRWLLVDTLHHRTGLRPPAWDFAFLEKNVAAFEFLIDIHYRYYKFYANMVVALCWTYLSGGYRLGWRGVSYGLLATLFLFASRDALGKYYRRSGRLLGDKRNTR